MATLAALNVLVSLLLLLLAGSDVHGPADPGNSLAGAEIQGRRPAAGRPARHGRARAHDCAADPRAPGVSLARAGE